MNKTTKFNNAFSKILTCFIVVLIVLGFSGVVMYLFAKSEGISFAVQSGGKFYYSGTTADSVYLPYGKSEFKFISFNEESVDFTVTVTSNSDNDFYFVINNYWHSFYDIDGEMNDYTDIFGVEYIDGGFSINIPDGMSVVNAIEQQYGENIVILNDIDRSLNYFLINVSSGDSTVIIPFNFGLFSIEVGNLVV